MSNTKRITIEVIEDGEKGTTQIKNEGFTVFELVGLMESMRVLFVSKTNLFNKENDEQH